MTNINIVFFGTPEFAVPSLRALAMNNETNVTLVVTQPDRRAGRGKTLRPPAVKVVADELGLPTIQPDSLRNEDAIERLRSENADVFIIVSYGEILRNDVIGAATYPPINIHPSLLPKYRGATPIPAAILSGDDETGVTFMQLVRKMDAGPILDQTLVPLTSVETTGSLAVNLANVAASQLPRIVKQWIRGEINAVPQDEADATYTRQFRKSDAQVDWTDTSTNIERFIRAMSPWPQAWTMLGEQRVAILEARVCDSRAVGGAGQFIELEESVRVSCSSGVIELTQVQPAGRKPMAARDWIRGLRDNPGIFAPLNADREPFIWSNARD